MLSKGQTSHGGGINLAVGIFPTVDYVIFNRFGISDFFNLGVSYKMNPIVTSHSIYWEFLPSLNLKFAFSKNPLKPVFIFEIGPQILTAPEYIKIWTIKNVYTIIFGIEELYGGLKSEIYWNTSGGSGVFYDFHFGILLGATLFSKYSVNLVPQFELVLPLHPGGSGILVENQYWRLNFGIALKFITGKNK